MSKIWLSSDHHFGHQAVIRFANRPFSSVANMNKLLVQNWNEVVAPEDIGIIVGDFAENDNPLSEVNMLKDIQYAFKMNGKLILVTGNHDRCWNKALYDDYNWWRDKYIEAGFMAVVDNIEMYLNDFEQTLSISHYPKWNIGENEWHIHGHTHSREKIKDQNIHVGVDAWDYYPVEMNTILGMIEV